MNEYEYEDGELCAALHLGDFGRGQTEAAIAALIKHLKSRAISAPQ